MLKMMMDLKKFDSEGKDDSNFGCFLTQEGLISVTTSNYSPESFSIPSQNLDNDILRKGQGLLGEMSAEKWPCGQDQLTVKLETNFMGMDPTLTISSDEIRSISDF